MFFNEYGNSCILYSMDKLLDYGDAINIIQADERGRISERKDVPLFDYEAFHEALLNAFVHNKWIGLNAPMISVFTDRIEILSHGGLGVEQDLEGFYNGVSIPVNEVLASIFLQLRLSERSGRGVPKIVGAYGRESIRIEKNFIIVTIPFNRINVTSFELNMGEKSEIAQNEPVNENLLGKLPSKLPSKLPRNLEITYKAICEDNYATNQELAIRTNQSERTIRNHTAKLKELNYIHRVGSDKTGHWEIL